MHNPQLCNVQTVIKRTCDHRQHCARQLVPRPKAQIIPIKICLQRLNRAGEKIYRLGGSGCEEKIVYSPRRPDKSVENMRWGFKNVFFEPDITLIIGKGNSARLDGPQKAGESPGRAV